MKTLYSIQYLRAIAALAVVSVHLGYSVGIPNLFPIGNAGVDIFFCISGFIIFTVTDHAESNPIVFAWDRIRRIVPLYWIVTISSVVVFIIKPKFIYGSDDNIKHIIKSLIFIPTRDMSGALFPVVRQGWTLNIEMFFYASMFIALYLKKEIQIFSVTIFLLTVFAIGLFYHPQNPAFLTYTNPRILEFVAGMWLGLATSIDRLPSRSVGTAAILLGAVLLLAPPLFSISPPAHLEFIYWGIPSFMILSGAVTVERRSDVWRWEFGRLLGDASYSIYLLHSFTLGLVSWSHVPLWLKIGLGLPVTVVVCVAAFLFVERPIMRTLRKIGPPKRYAGQP